MCDEHDCSAAIVGRPGPRCGIATLAGRAAPSVFAYCTGRIVTIPAVPGTPLADVRLAPAPPEPANPEGPPPAPGCVCGSVTLTPLAVVTVWIPAAGELTVADPPTPPSAGLADWVHVPPLPPLATTRPLPTLEFPPILPSVQFTPALVAPAVPPAPTVTVREPPTVTATSASTYPPWPPPLPAKPFEGLDPPPPPPPPCIWTMT